MAPAVTGGRSPERLADAVDLIQAGVRAAHAQVGDAELAGLAAPDDVTFHALCVYLGVGWKL